MTKESIRIVEVGPRDGLQFEDVSVSLADKLEFIHRLAKSRKSNGIIEAASFVSPKYVPQMADSDRLTDILRAKAADGQFPGIHFSFLTINKQGAEIAIESGVSKEFGEFAVVVGASDKFNKDNLGIDKKDADSAGLSTADFAIQKLAKPVIDLGKSQSIRTRGYVSTIFQDPDKNPVDPEKVAGIAKKLLEAGVYEVSLGDTTGAGTPEAVEALMAALKKQNIPLDKVTMHFHDTRGKAVENARKAYELGIRSFDSSAGGLGGCKYAGSKVGNVATEDLVDLFDNQLKEKTGIAMPELLSASGFMLGKIGRQSMSATYRRLADGAAPEKAAALSDTKREPSARVMNDGAFHFKDLNIHVDGRGVATVALNRPQKHNAFDDNLIEQITQAFTALEEDAAVKVIVLSGEGPSFSAGADLNWMKRMASYSRDENVADAMKLATMYETIRTCLKPVIARVHGNVMAGGTGLAAASDVVIAEAGTKFQISEVNLGLRPSTISRYLIPKIGAHNARVLFTGGEKFYANRAKDYGLVDIVKPAEEMDRVVEDGIQMALRGGKTAFRNIAAANMRRESHKPEPKRYALDSKDAEYGRKLNHNKILDLVDGVEKHLAALDSEGRQPVMEFTAGDIADARTSDYAQAQMQQFFDAQDKARAAKIKTG